jgi:hypothetical protein
MVFGEERLYKTNVRLKYRCEFYLRFLGNDSTGFKMHGTFPNLWKVTDQKITGPQLIDEDGIYNIARVDYNKNNIWLTPLTGEAQS